MKKLNYGSIGFEANVKSDFIYINKVACSYDRATVAYAVERFIAKEDRFRRACAFGSWKLRLVSGKKKEKAFSYEVPAYRMELPGYCVTLRGYLNPAGVQITGVEME